MEKGSKRIINSSDGFAQGAYNSNNSRKPAHYLVRFLFDKATFSSAP